MSTAVMYGDPTAEIQALKLSKIDHYLIENVPLLRLSELKNMVKRKKGWACRLDFGMRVSRPRPACHEKTLTSLRSAALQSTAASAFPLALAAALECVRENCDAPMRGVKLVRSLSCSAEVYA